MQTYRVYKMWLLRLVLSIASLMLLLGAFNYAVDPHWCFSHKGWLNSYQKFFNERQQKTNYLTYVNTKKYDTLILGPSRACMINQNDFSGMQVYNYSAAALSPYEFRSYIDYFKKVSGKPKTIFLGLHFQNTNQQVKGDSPEQAEQYFKNAQSPLYRFKMLLTKDAFTYSSKNMKIEKELIKIKNDTSFYMYDHNNVATLIRSKKEPKRLEGIRTEVSSLRKTYRSDYIYRDDLAKSMAELIQENPGSKFIPFTTPVSQPYFCAMVLEGRFPQYERWLEEMVDVFGLVWHFEYLNSITANYDKNFSDSHHFFEPIGTMMAHRMIGVYDAAVPSDFGMLLTKDTIKEQLAKIKADSAVCQ